MSMKEEEGSFQLLGKSFYHRSELSQSPQGITQVDLAHTHHPQATNSMENMCQTHALR